MKHVGRVWLISLLASLVAMPAVVCASSDPTSDTAVKAAFLYHFARFADWPSSSPARPLTLCVVGDARIASALVETVRNKRLNGRSLDVKGLGSDGPVRSCDVLFISASEMGRATVVMGSLQALSILTVSDDPGFAHSNGIIEFVVESGRVQFAINTDAADRAGLRLSSRLLGLARIVRDDHVH